jgi:hypothetical protein
MKYNDDFLRLARWVVPGWTCIGAFVAFIALDIISSPTGQPHIYQSLNIFISSITRDMGSVEATLLIFIGGIPLGFSIYQVYFFLRWNSPFARNGLISFIPGRTLDLDLSTLDIEKKSLVRNQKWRKNWVFHPLYESDHGFRWRYIELFFNEAVQKVDVENPGFTYSRHRYLHEIVHTLGASIGAVYIGFAGYFLIKLDKQHFFAGGYLLFTIAIMGTLFVLMYLEDKKRIDSLKSLGEENLSNVPFTTPSISCREITFAHPSSFFVFLLLGTHFLSNPQINPVKVNTFDTLVRVFILLLAWSVWAATQDRSTSTKKGTLLLLLIFTIVSIAVKYISINFSNWDWPYFASLTLFIVANLVLFLNRRNARDDMLALEYYTFRIYLTKARRRTKKKIQ